MIDLNGRLAVSTANSVYHLGPAGTDGVREVRREGRDLGFSRGVLLGPANNTILGGEVDFGKPLTIGRCMAIKPAGREDNKAWITSSIVRIENN